MGDVRQVFLDFRVLCRKQDELIGEKYRIDEIHRRSVWSVDHT